MALFVLLYFLLFHPTHALDEFQVDQTITITLADGNDAQINHKIDIKNNFSSLYPKDFYISHPDQIVKNISSLQDSSPAPFSFNGQTIKVTIPNPQVGKDKLTHLSISYDLLDIAIPNGHTHEINIPKFSSSLNSKTNIVIIYPSTYGNIIYSSQPGYKFNPSFNINKITFTQLAPSNIHIVTGSMQAFDFSLNYFLKNDTPQPDSYSISLPPDTDTQTIILTTIDPQPQNISIDEDGNYLASYQLDPSQTLDVLAQGQIQLHQSRSDFVYPPAQDYQTQSQGFWITSDVSTISQKLSTPRQIYDFVVDKLQYNFFPTSTITRRNVFDILTSDQKSVCTDYTDLFITIARSKNIPARQIIGFINSPELNYNLPFSKTTDVLHTWPQYYDPNQKRWISLDPTWADTSPNFDYFDFLDFNHVVLTIHGRDSELPYPPGYQKKSGTKAVNITVSTNLLTPPKSKYAVTLDRQTSKIILTNPNQTTAYNINFSIPDLNFNQHISALPPYAHIDISIPKSVLFFKKTMLVDLSSSDYQGQIYIDNPYRTKNLLNLTFISVLILSVSGIIITRKK